MRWTSQNPDSASNGLFITFEGIDGCGKSLQAKKLAEALTDHGHPVLFVREPGGNEISEKIRDILLDARHHGMSPLTEFFLYESARAQLMEVLILPALESGKIVIADRFFDSTVTYQGYGRGLSLDMIDQTNVWACKGVQPDRTYFIDIPFEESIKRRSKLDEEEDRMENQSDSFFNKVREGYRQLVDANPERIRYIDGMSTIESIANEILTDVQHLLHK